MPLLAVLAAISLSTQGGAFLAHEGSAYVAGPTYVIAQASADARFRWNEDGSRLAYVTQASTESPRTVAGRLSRGESAKGLTRLGVWSYDSGRSRDILVSVDPTQGVDQLEFLGKDLVFSTFASGESNRVWIARDGSSAKEIPLPDGDSANIRFEAARHRYALLMASDGLWIVTSSGTRRLDTKGYSSFLPRGVTDQNKALVLAQKDEGGSDWLSVDLATGAVTRTEDGSAASRAKRAFLLHAFELKSTRAELEVDQGDLRALDMGASPLAEEDAGYRLDLVESTGDKRRRIPFIYEMAKYVEVTRDGLHFAFVSNRVIMARSMVKLDKTASEKLLGKS